MPTEPRHRRTWFGRLCDGLSGPQSYDLTGLKQIERTPSIEVLVRFGLSTLMATAGAILFGAPVLYLWAAAFLGSQLALFAPVRRMPQIVGHGRPALPRSCWPIRARHIWFRGAFRCCGASRTWRTLS